MRVSICGVNHKTAPLALRERLAFVPEQMPEPLHHLMAKTKVSEAMILSTCNRTELYCSQGSASSLVAWLSERHHISANDIMPHVYYHEGNEAVRHMLRVAAGLDSMVLGEPQILGQIKAAVQTAISAGTVGSRLHRLFQYVFSVTKSVRQQTGIGSQAISIAYCAIDLAKHIFANLHHNSVLMIGAGNTIELCLRYLQKHQVNTIRIANRTFAKAEQLAQQFQAQAIPIEQITEYISHSDIIISAAATSLPLVGKGMVERALKLRKHKPMLMIDLGVPRNIEPEIAELADVYLYSIDDLQQIIQTNLQDRKLAAAQAEEMIDIQTEHFARWLNSLNAVNTIQDFRNNMLLLSQQEAEKALTQLQLGKDSTVIIKELARALTNKLIHTPTINLRSAGYNDQQDIIAAARILFNLD
jgi:glutamyl-tRNA reductase